MFEQYQKASRALPDKKEREEITLLKQKVCFHGDKLWTRTRSKYTDLGEFETIWLYKTIRL